MSYEYEKERPYIFTEKGQIAFLRIRDQANELCKRAGACDIEHLMMNAGSGDSWKTLACIDRLVEIKEFRYVNEEEGIPTQLKILVKR